MPGQIVFKSKIVFVLATLFIYNTNIFALNTESLTLQAIDTKCQNQISWYFEEFKPKNFLNFSDNSKKIEQLGIAISECDQELANAITKTQSVSFISNKQTKQQFLYALNLLQDNLEVFESQLNKLLQITNAISLRAQIAGLEQLNRRLLIIVSERETWESAIKTAALNRTWQNSANRGGVGAELNLAIDHGSLFEGQLKLSTVSPLKEETGVFTYPPNEIDLVSLSEAWLNYKRFKRIQIKFGIFSERLGFIGPQSWPLMGIQGSIWIVDDVLLKIWFRARHDFIGLYSSNFQVPKAQLLERNVPELKANTRYSLWGYKFESEFISLLHWYADPKGVLKSLSLGRDKPIENGVAELGTQYRISENIFSTHITFNSNWSSKIFIQHWVNILKSSDSRGWTSGVQTNFTDQSHSAQFTFQLLQSGCSSLPPIQMSSAFIPGANGYNSSFLYEYLSPKSVTLFFGLQFFATRPWKTAGQCIGKESVVQANTIKSGIEAGLSYDLSHL